MVELKNLNKQPLVLQVHKEKSYVFHLFYLCLQKYLSSIVLFKAVQASYFELYLTPVYFLWILTF